MERGPKVDRAQLFSLAGQAQVDPRTVERALRGASIRGMAGDRVRAALAAAGLAPAAPSPTK
jgi:hypothetical protein